MLSGSAAIIAILSIVAGFILLYILLSIKVSLNEKKQKNAQQTQEKPQETEEEFNAVGAVVLSKESVLHTTRHNHSLNFKVTFMTDDGTKIQLTVPQEVYESIYESQVGDLVTVNGNFFYFGDGESVE